MASATEEQESFIRTIALELRVYEPMHLSKSEASRWISDHIEQYNEIRETQWNQLDDS
ncbi:hypothetical protein ACFQ44_05860 [Levilactobacillus lanxiensis]|uniref:Uncharacterized protein n=1 Tax=Levilactobacillus lanxiensis TaxID=2799568 RepID=A0ABW4D342_9LACO|nr:hypothetical protein [Levilactobacillus lanxiensis]